MDRDIIATFTFTVQAVLLPAIAIFGSRLEGTRRWWALGIAGAWLLSVAGFAAAGLFSGGGFGTPLLGAAAALPILAIVLLRSRSATLQFLLSSIPLSLLIALHAGRLLGIDFLLLQSAGRLPATFARASGWGGIFWAIAALPLAS